MSLLKIAALLGCAVSFAQADTLRLRDGMVIVGTYVGGTQTEIWFQRSPAGAEPFPLFAVESVRFGTLLGSSTPKPSALKIARVHVTRKRPPQFAQNQVQMPPTLAALFRRWISGTGPPPTQI
jgi:hypothetical protein